VTGEIVTGEVVAGGASLGVNGLCVRNTDDSYLAARLRNAASRSPIAL